LTRGSFGSPCARQGCSEPPTGGGRHVHKKGGGHSVARPGSRPLGCWDWGEMRQGPEKMTVGNRDRRKVSTVRKKCGKNIPRWRTARHTTRGKGVPSTTKGLSGGASGAGLGRGPCPPPQNPPDHPGPWLCVPPCPCCFKPERNQPGGKPPVSHRGKLSQRGPSNTLSIRKRNTAQRGSRVGAGSAGGCKKNAGREGL